VWWQDRLVELSAREFELLQIFMLSAGRVLSREQLETQLYQWGHEVASNTIEVHIYHLRRKFWPGLINTLRGVGYSMSRASVSGVAS
jgi:two-component system OmpR family response regulator/two-component system response regulator QseB